MIHRHDAIAISIMALVAFLIIGSWQGSASTIASVTTDSATLTATTNVTLFGNITDYGTYNNLTAGFVYSATGQATVQANDGSSSPPAPPYPNFIQGWNARAASASHDIASLAVTVNTTSGDSQVIAIAFCQFNAGTGISVSGGFATVLDNTSATVLCAGLGMRYYLGVRLAGSHVTSFTATFSPGTLYGVNIYVAEYARLGVIGASYTKTQTAAEPFITETIPAQSILFAYATEGDNVAATTFVDGHDRYRACNTLPGGSVCLAIGDNENADMSVPASVTVKPHYAASHTVEFNAVSLTYASPPHAFSLSITGLKTCTKYTYRAFITTSPSGDPPIIAYGSAKTFTTPGACPSIFSLPGADLIWVLIFIAVLIAILMGAWAIRKRRG